MRGDPVTAVDQEGELVHVRLSDGTVRQVVRVVGADGIRSIRPAKTLLIQITWTAQDAEGIFRPERGQNFTVETV